MGTIHFLMRRTLHCDGVTEIEEKNTDLCSVNSTTLLSATFTNCESLFILNTPLLRYLKAPYSALTSVSNLQNLVFLDCSFTSNLFVVYGLLHLKILICNESNVHVIESLPKLEMLECISCKVKSIKNLPKLKEFSV